jgi:hypothetical protein
VGDQVAALELAAVVVGEHELEGEQLGARAGVELELDAVGRYEGAGLGIRAVHRLDPGRAAKPEVGGAAGVEVVAAPTGAIRLAGGHDGASGQPGAEAGEGAGEGRRGRGGEGRRRGGGGEQGARDGDEAALAIEEELQIAVEEIHAGEALAEHEDDPAAAGVVGVAEDGAIEGGGVGAVGGQEGAELGARGLLKRQVSGGRGGGGRGEQERGGAAGFAGERDARARDAAWAGEGR